MNDRQLWPSIMLVTAAAGWGLFWIPLRELEGAGLSAGWAGFSQFVTPALVLLPLALIFMVRGKATGMGRWKTAFFTGGAFALYADSLLLTEVARALILFYVTPAWSTMLEVWLMKRKVTAARIIAITLGFAGLYVILGGDGSLPIPRNAGDWMALASGMFWAYGSTWVRMAGEASLFENVFSFFGLRRDHLTCPGTASNRSDGQTALDGSNYRPRALAPADSHWVPDTGHVYAALWHQAGRPRACRNPVPDRSDLWHHQRSNPDSRAIRMDRGYWLSPCRQCSHDRGSDQPAR